MQKKMKSKRGFQGFLVKYDLSSEEGVLLMCLAEALLRIPDAHTTNLLIEDKVCQANWQQHLDRKDSLFINASTWGLMLTGKLLKKGPEVFENPNSLLDRIKSTRGEPFFRKVISQAIRIMSEQFIMGESIQKALKRARKPEKEGFLYNTAAVIDADGTYLGKYRKTHIPQVNGFWEKFYFRPGNLGYPVFDTAVGKVGVYICYDRHFPEGWRALGLNGAQMVFNPSATSRGLSRYLWQIEQPASAVANMYFVGAINRVGVEDLGENDFYGNTYFVDPRGQYVGDICSDTEEELIVRDLDLDMVEEVRNQWAFYRDRRPDQYDPLVQP